MQGGPDVLTNVEWHLNLMMGQSSLTRMKDTTAVFELVLAKPEGAQVDTYAAFTVIVTILLCPRFQKNE
jgi:hypothetical protein